MREKENNESTMRKRERVQRERTQEQSESESEKKPAKVNGWRGKNNEWSMGGQMTKKLQEDPRERKRENERES